MKKSAPAAAPHLSLSTLAHPGLSPWLRAEKPAPVVTTVRHPLPFQPHSGVVIAQPWCGPQCCWDCCTTIPMWCWSFCCLVGPCVSRCIFTVAAVHHACKLIKLAWQLIRNFCKWFSSSCVLLRVSHRHACPPNDTHMHMASCWCLGQK